MRCDEAKKNSFLESLDCEIRSVKNVCADTIYVGGGTPSVLSGDDISDVITLAKNQFCFSDGEITVEANPSSLTFDFADKAARAGVNRFSLGVQSAIESERKILGRKSSAEEIKEKIFLLKSLGINNISLDVMLGVPGQTLSSLKETLEFCIKADVKHVSAYILKIEEGTFFFRSRDKLSFPDEDMTSQMYEFTCDHLRQNGFCQYEISNFAKEGFESKHNLKYWNCEEYLGFGPSAHSFFEGKRFYHENSLEKYTENPFDHTDDGEGGSFEEYAMLKLRLSKGLLEDEVQRDYGFSIPESLRKNAETFLKNNYVVSDKKEYG